MSTAIALWDVVCEAENILVIAVIPLKRGFNGDAIFLTDCENRFRNGRGTLTIEMLYEGFHAAIILEDCLIWLCAAQVFEHNTHARVQKGELAQTMFQRAAIVLCHRESRWCSKEAHARSGIVTPVFALRAVANFFQRRFSCAAINEPNEVLFTFAVNAQLQPIGQSVYNGNTHPVQTARNLIGILVEFTACVQLGHDDLCRRDTLCRVRVDRHASAVVRDLGRPVSVQDDRGFGRVPRKRFVNCVIDGLVNHVVKTRTIVRVTNVHARAFPDGLKPFQDLD